MIKILILFQRDGNFNFDLKSRLLFYQGPLISPVRKALSYYTHMGKTMEEELKKQEKKHSREENREKIETKVHIETTGEKQETIETKEAKQEKILLKEDEQQDNNMDSKEEIQKQ